MNWISTNERFPDEMEEVLTWNGAYFQIAAIWGFTDGEPMWLPPFEATHWMPLPQQPNNEVVRRND